MNRRYRSRELPGLKAYRRLRGRVSSGDVVPTMDDPFDTTSEVIDVATGELITPRVRSPK